MPTPTLRSVALIFVSILLLSFAASAQTFTTLAFLNQTTGNPVSSPLIQGFDGNLYGSTASEGAWGGGTFFQLTPSDTVNTLYNFCDQDNNDCPDGDIPSGSIALGTDGNFYGTTQGDFFGTGGNGTAYKITSTGSMTVLHTFCALANCADGIYPSLGLTFGRNGDLYGVTSSPEESSAYYGVLFEMSTSGTLHPLITVCPNDVCPVNAGPFDTMTLSTSGSLIAPGYTANFGVALYSMTPSGTSTLVYTFCDDSTCHDGGQYIPSPIAQSASGAVYGTFSSGGSGANCTGSGGCGTAFRLITAHGGSFTKLHDFCSLSDCADGEYPNALILASDGNLYGTTDTGGAHGDGVLFRITSTGHFSVVHSFSSADGDNPVPYALFQATDGNLYGSTRFALFRLSLGLAPFVRTVQNAASVGSTVVLLGNNLTGTSAVTFNGVSASFTVVSPTEITATVPTGATTGTIRVTTPTSTLNSNVAFEVLP